MELFEDTSLISTLLKIFLVVFYCPFLSWVPNTSRKLYHPSNHLSFLFLPLLGTFISPDEEEGDALEEYPRGDVRAVQRQGTEGEVDLRVSRRDVESVMARLGLGCCSDGGELSFKDALGAREVNGIFEEKEPSLEEVREAFRVFDHNGDGFIDAPELQRVFSLLELSDGLISTDDCRRMIEPYDENGDGRIDFHEFVKFMESSFCA